MSSKQALADKLLARVGKTRADVHPRSKVGQAFRRKGVQRTADFVRVLCLPRRDWREGAEELAELITERYARTPDEKCPESCVCRGKGFMKLHPVQAAALGDLHDFGGLFAPIIVGGGKTLISFLAPAILEAERPLVLIPAKLKKKTESEWWLLSVHWRLPPVRIETYEKLGRVENVDLLETYRPDFIFADEAHRLKNTSAGVTRRVNRYLQHAECRVALASGTITNKSLKEYWHLLRWSLGPELMPMPREWPEMMEWASALDVQSNEAVRTAPGALSEFAGHKGHVSLEAAREGYRKRLVESPGVVATSNSNVAGCSLSIAGVDLPKLDVLGPHYKQLREDWQTPDGWDFSEAIDLWRHARELVCGFYNVWDPRPPKLWMQRRRNWHRFVRQTLKHLRQYDTELQVSIACSKGHLDSFVEVEEPGEKPRYADVFKEWREVRDTFVPNAVPVWVDDTALNYAAKWLEEHDGVVWVEHPCFGEKLEKLCGVPYYGRGGLNSKKEMIERARGKAIASVLANGEGRNLQHWSEALVVSCPPNGKAIEQLLGRHHRPGQEEDEVSFEFVLACKEQVEGFHKALREAEYIEQSTGNMQKLMYADKTVMSMDELARARGPRWSE